ncbi:MAG: sugar ABC transporter permease [Anaerolineae bacterium]|nr:sugar ABC transporter permease [Anaerolineae bacterium]
MGGVLQRALHAWVTRPLRLLMGGSLRRQQNLFVWLSLVPVLAYFTLFNLYPIVSALNVSLRRWRFAEPHSHPFVGLENYAWALQDEVFWVSLRNSLLFLVGHVGLQLVVALVLAVILFPIRQPWRGVLTAVCFLPVVTSAVAVSLIFRDLFAPVTGPLNYLLGLVGLGPYNYLTTSMGARVSVIAITNWKNLGVWLVLYLAGLTTIPAELDEAAAIDGASRVQAFLFITIPLLRPTLVYLVVMGTVGTLQDFTGIYTLTGGGPGTATRTLVLHIYQHAFNFFDMGRGSAVAFVLFVALAVVSALQLRVLRHDFEY